MNAAVADRLTLRHPQRVGANRLTRVAGAALLVATAVIHLHLYRSGYSGIPTIGRLFLLNVVAGLGLAVAVLAAPLVLPPRLATLDRLAAGAAALFEAGTLIGLLVTVTHGLFGFQDTSSAPCFSASIVVESVGVLVLARLSSLPSLRRSKPAAGR